MAVTMNFPDEIVLNIVTLLPSDANLKDVACISKQFRRCVSTLYWTSIGLTIAPKAGQKARMTAVPPLELPEDRFRQVKRLAIDFKSSSRSSTTDLGLLLNEMSNVRELKVKIKLNRTLCQITTPIRSVSLDFSHTDPVVRRGRRFDPHPPASSYKPPRMEMFASLLALPSLQHLGLIDMQAKQLSFLAHDVSWGYELHFYSLCIESFHIGDIADFIPFIRQAQHLRKVTFTRTNYLNILKRFMPALWHSCPRLESAHIVGDREKTADWESPESAYCPALVEYRFHKFASLKEITLPASAYFYGHQFIDSLPCSVEILQIFFRSENPPTIEEGNLEMPQDPKAEEYIYQAKNGRTQRLPNLRYLQLNPLFLSQAVPTNSVATV